MALIKHITIGTGQNDPPKLCCISWEELNPELIVNGTEEVTCDRCKSIIRTFQILSGENA